MSFTVYYASDIHGSDRLWRKFVNAGKFYDADVLVMGGDITGKAVVPIVRENGGFRATQVIGDRIAGEDELPDIERRVRDMGFYPYVMEADELAEAQSREGAVDELFRRAMAASLERWLA